MTAGEAPTTLVYATPDGHLNLVLAVLNGIETPEQRAEWVSDHMPLTSAHLLDGFDWERASVHVGNGNGSVSRPALAPPAPPPPALPAQRPCKECGGLYVPKPQAHHSFYCDKCLARHALPAVRPCIDCGRGFRERWRRRCSDCRARRAAPHAPRYREKPCRTCGECFTPTTGRQWFCPTCAGARTTPRKQHRTFKQQRRCVVCHRPYLPTMARQVACGAACQRARLRARYRRWWRDVGSARQRAWYAAKGKALRAAARKAKAPGASPCYPCPPDEATGNTHHNGHVEAEVMPQAMVTA